MEFDISMNFPHCHWGYLMSRVLWIQNSKFHIHF